MICYTYLLYNGKQFYIGWRKLPNHLNKVEEDYEYLGSSTDKDFNNTIVSKTILKVFNNKDEAILHEIQLHQFFDVGRNKLFANKARATSSGFILHQPISEESRAKMSRSLKERYKDPKNREKISVATKKAMECETIRKKISDGVKRAWKDPVKGESMRQGYLNSLEKRSKATREAYSKPEVRQRLRDSLNKPETKIKNSKAKSGANNSAYDHTIYHFFCLATSEEFIGTRYYFLHSSVCDISRGSINVLVLDGGIRKDWVVL